MEKDEPRAYEALSLGAKAPIIEWPVLPVFLVLFYACLGGSPIHRLAAEFIETFEYVGHERS